MIKLKSAAFLCLALAACRVFAENPRYIMDLEIDFPELAGHVNLASVELVNPSEEKWDFPEISIKDDNEDWCEIRKISNNGPRHLEVFFTPSSSRFYRAYIKKGEKGTPGTEANLKKGELLIEDSIPPGSTKAGHWNWVSSPKLSGSLSLTGKEGTSFKRVVFPRAHTISKKDKLVIYLYCPQENMPDEILVEIVTIRRKNYFFSWGKDIINTDRTKKIEAGELPEGGKWQKIEIPFTNVAENRLQALGLYHSGGRVWWDRISLNDVPVEAAVKKVKEENKKATAYFSHILRGPFKEGDTVFEILELDASPSHKAEKFMWEVAQRHYSGEKLEMLLNQGESRKVSLTVESQGIKDTMEYEIPAGSKKPEGIKVLAKILPYRAFISEKENFTAVLSVTNLNSGIIPFEVRALNFRELLSPGPGETKHVYLNIPASQMPEKIKAGLYLHSIKLDEKSFSVVSPEVENIKADGPFIKDANGDYLVIRFPEQKLVDKKPGMDSWEILLAGCYPEGTEELLQEALLEIGIKSSVAGGGAPAYGRKHKLFAEYMHATEKLKEAGNGDIFIFFPYVESVRQKSSLVEWRSAIEALSSTAEKRFAEIILAAPFPAPPFPDLYAPYRNALENTASSRKAYFLDTCSLYLSEPGWKKFFMHGEGIYRNIPGREGTGLIVKELVNLLNRIYVDNY